MNEEQAVMELLGDGGIAFGMAAMMMVQHLTTEHGMTKGGACHQLGISEAQADQVVDLFKAIMDGES